MNILLILLLNTISSIDAFTSFSRLNRGIQEALVQKEPSSYHYSPAYRWLQDVGLNKNKACSRMFMVSELHIPQYRQTKLPFMIEVEEANRLQESSYSSQDYQGMIPYEDGHLCFKTNGSIFTSEECSRIVMEAEEVCNSRANGWTTSRHANYPTTDIPIVELKETTELLREALHTKIYPLLREQFKDFLPAGGKTLRVVDGFVVKYDADGGQTELKPHRDGSVLSFNIALNSAHEYEGGGTWFNSLNQSVKIDQGEICSHASGILHGGHGITQGKRYILVAFVIVENYDSWSMRFYNQIREK